MLERNAIMEQRLAKVAALGAGGQPAYPNDFVPTHTAAEAYAWFAAEPVRHADFVAIEEGKPIPADLPVPQGAPVLGSPWVRLAGRVVSIAVKGKVAFIKVQDRSAVQVKAERMADTQRYNARKQALALEAGAEAPKPREDDGASSFQFYFSREVDPEVFDRLCKATPDANWEGPLLDVGDVVGGEGLLFRTRTGEPSLWLRKPETGSALRILTKAVRPLPDKWHGLADKEARLRMRYVDLIVNDDVREVFAKRSKILREVRNFLDGEGYVEVETPMMHPVLGGAAARPFKTHHNALDMPLYLRIAPELYLKRLVVGGIDRVYEVNRNFRNEGLSVRHNPEFTMLEFYRAYATYLDLMTEVETLIRTVATKVCGTTTLVWGKNADGSDRVIDVGQPFARVSIREGLQRWAGIAASDLENEAVLRARADELGVHIDAHATLGKVQVELFEAAAEPLLVQPTFVYEYPAETSPLARRNDADPRFVDRFELFVGGIELSNAFSELNDPVDQYERFLAQLQQKAKGDEEAMEMDLDYVRALEYGLPPTAGCGIGIDRLVMLLTGTDAIREVILFPHMRPEARTDAQAGASEGDNPPA